MRLFKSNKSQGSLNNITAKSPINSPIDSPLQSPAFPPPQTTPFSPEPAEVVDDTPLHPAHTSIASRPGTQDSAVQRQGGPVVNVIPDTFDENHLLPLNAGQQTHQTLEDPSAKRHSKRSFFGLHSSKDSHSTGLGRRFSTRRKASSAGVEEGVLQPSTSTVYSSDTYDETGSSNENIPSRDTDPDEQYYRQPPQQPPLQGQPQQQQPPHFDPPPTQFRAYHPPEDQQPQQGYPRPYPGQNTSGTYLPYPPPQQDRPSLEVQDPYHQFRPPSQQSLVQSLGPPSPVASLQQLSDSRGLQARPPPQFLPPPTVAQSDMPRGEANNPANRQMAQQHAQNAEHAHGGYGIPQGARQLPHQSSSMGEHGRNTPPPAKGRDEQEWNILIQKHEELQAKYSKVKKYYFEKDAQVTALQNTVANQRLSMSKTTLDDHEYTTRFNRLNGAIDNLSFNIRKGWKGVPPWLSAMVNRDAHHVGTKEMTAVGRACITRWVVDEILDRYFHPRLEPALSSELKMIERNLRRNGQVQVTSDEQRDDLVVKLTSWRLTTLEGLADIMASERGEEYKQTLSTVLTEKLIASLQMNLTEPSPAGLESGVVGIIDLAIGLASSLPLESRDVCITYFMPDAYINETYMKMESGIPPLINPGAAIEFARDTGDQASTNSADENSDNEGEKDSNGGLPPRGDSAHAGAQQPKKDSKKGGFLGGLVGSSKKATGPENGGAPGAGNRMGSAGSGLGGAGPKDRESLEKLNRDRERKIRFATFVGVEVRGKGKEGGIVLVKAPCYGF